jgi:hypothetical protein
MTAPAFLENVDQEERDELASLIGQLQQPTGDADLDAVASRALLEMAREDAEINRYAAALKAEMERIEARYIMLQLPHVQRRASAEEIVKECARRAQFVGKSKSRKVGNGTYGRKTVPEKVSIVDKVAALRFAQAECPPEAVKEKVELTVVHAIVAPVVLARIHKQGLLPNGFEHVSEHEEFYAKPLPLEGSSNG